MKTNFEVWGGIECSINRVNDRYFDQLDYAGHYTRDEDIERFAGLGIKKMRYPILWERHQAAKDSSIDWTLTERKLNKFRLNGIDIIAGLVHHGSGPSYVNMPEDSFAYGLAAYAIQVAEKFPWIKYYTPVNEPLTTARFCGLYGIWYPHCHDDKSFCRILVNECKATVLAMQGIRKINPEAELIQTEDLAKVHSTPLLKYQADFENERRWLSYDLLCGYVNKNHPLWDYLLSSGISEEDLDFFRKNTCPPDILGFNHYLTSERYLDENLENFPAHTHGGNGIHSYADVEAVRVGHICPDGPYKLLKEAWHRYQKPIAVTEVHLYCTREEQMRWLTLIYNDANKLQKEGVDIRGITPWALLGSFGWNSLLTEGRGDYESGVFDLNGDAPRPTALAKMIKSFSENRLYHHPVINDKGWWQRSCRVIYGVERFFNEAGQVNNSRPLLIIGKSGTLGNAFARICGLRGINFRLLGHLEMDIQDPLQIDKVVSSIMPWAVVNTAGFVRVDDAEMESGSCFAINTLGVENLAVICNKYRVKLLTFSTDLVFNGLKTNPYTEKDVKSPLNVYGYSKALAEEKVMRITPDALVIRTSAFFGPWDQYNFITVALNSLKNNEIFNVVEDVRVSPTYVPDLVNASLDLLIDDEKGIWHLSNAGQISWAELAYTVAELKGLQTSLIVPKQLKDFNFKAQRPLYSVLNTERGNTLPPLHNAIDRYLQQIEL